MGLQLGFIHAPSASVERTLANWHLDKNRHVRKAGIYFAVTKASCMSSFSPFVASFRAFQRHSFDPRGHGGL